MTRRLYLVGVPGKFGEVATHTTRLKRVSYVAGQKAGIVSVVLYPSSGAAWSEGSSGHGSNHDIVIAPGT